jgi:hypothetical protein
MTDELKEKIKKLPLWARELIHYKDQTIDHLRGEPNRLHQEIEHLRKVNTRLAAVNQAQQELLCCAAKGGHPDAREYVEYVFREFGPQPEETNE